jgi:MFS family permease
LTYGELLRGNANFRRLWAGQVISEVGDWLNNIAVLALLIEIAGAGSVGVSLALYAIARHLPLFLFGPVAGVVVDHADRRRVMIAADVARAVLSLGFLFAARLESVTLIYFVGAALFAVAAFFNAAKRATVPNLVSGTEELLSANSLSASTTAATIAVGSALGGMAAAALGRDAVFVANALTFVASAEMIRRIRAASSQRAEVSSDQQQAANSVAPTPVGTMPRGTQVAGRELRTRVEAETETPNSKPETSVRRSPLGAYFTDFKEGLKYVRSDSALAAVFVVAAGWGMGNGAARALYSLFGAEMGAGAIEGWGEGWRSLVERPTDFGISVLFVAMGVGGVLGAPLARRFTQAGEAGIGTRMGRSLVLDGCGLALFSLVPNLWGASVVLIAREMNFAIWWTAQQTLIMRRTADRFAGRIFASFETLTTLMMVGSMLVAGAAADRAGIRIVTGLAGAVIALSGLLWFILRRRAREAPARTATTASGASE